MAPVGIQAGAQLLSRVFSDQAGAIFEAIGICRWARPVSPLVWLPAEATTAQRSGRFGEREAFENTCARPRR
eukprot:6741201-Lingulodinium_polyedra.AAC.1